MENKLREWHFCCWKHLGSGWKSDKRARFLQSYRKSKFFQKSTIQKWWAEGSERRKRWQWWAIVAQQDHARFISCLYTGKWGYSRNRITNKDLEKYSRTIQGQGQNIMWVCEKHWWLDRKKECSTNVWSTNLQRRQDAIESQWVKIQLEIPFIPI